jgi:phage-related protein
MMDSELKSLKPVRWIGSSRRDLKSFPKTIQRDIGQALYAAQLGEVDAIAFIWAFGRIVGITGQS